MIRNKNKKYAKRTIIDFLRIPIILLQLAMSGILCYSIFKLNIFQVWQISILVGLLAIFLLFNTIKLFRWTTGPVTRVIVVILSLIVSGACFISFRNLNETITFLEHVTETKTKVINYSVLVEKESTYEQIEDISGKKIGFISVDQYIIDSKSKLKETISFEGYDSTDLGSLAANLDQKTTSAIVLNQNYLDLIKENNEDYYSSLREIYTFEIRVKDEGEDTKDVKTDTEPFTILISGSDSRTGISAVARSDVNILAAVNPEQGKILLVAIPRDYYVQLHGTTGTKDKLTHAGVYGVDMSKATIEDLLGIKIDYTLKVSFDTVIKIVDTIGGIDINSDKEFTAWTNDKCHFKVGTQHVDSNCALAFSRERMSYETGDRHRGENQEAVIGAIFDKVMSPSYLIKYTDILHAIDGSFETDFSMEDITDFARKQLSSLKKWSLENYNLNGVGSMQPTYSMGSRPLYVMIPDETTIANAKTKIADIMSTTVIEDK